MTIDTEKLRALSRDCEYTIEAVPVGDVTELWAIRCDDMGRPYHSRIGVTVPRVAAIIAAAVNALPGLLDALGFERRENAEHERNAERVWAACPDCMGVKEALDGDGGDGSTADRVRVLRNALAMSREKVGNQRAQLRRFNRDGQAVSDALIGSMYEKSRLLKERTRALATAEDERLTLARAIRGGNAHLSPTVNELAARIVAEADAASKEVGS